jgi:hypothetical protein
MKLPINSLQTLVKEAFDPKNPFGPLVPQLPKPTPVKPSGPYVPTPGGVKPKNPKVVTPPKSSGYKSPWTGFGPAVLRGAQPQQVKNTTDSVNKLFTMISDVAKGAGAFAATPPREQMAATTGRLAGLGFSNQGIEDRMKYYKSVIGGINPLAWMATAAGGAANTAAKGGSVVGGGLLGGLASFTKQWADATTEEPAKLMTAALYDPRSLGRMK